MTALDSVAMKSRARPRVSLRLLSTQKLGSKEVKEIIAREASFFDSKLNLNAPLNKNLDKESLLQFCNEAKISKSINDKLLLESLIAAKQGSKGRDWYLTNAGVLLFVAEPKKIIPESYITVVRYHGTDRFRILDRQEFSGNVISQVSNAINFVKRHLSVNYEISSDAKRLEYFDYPLVAIREAVINAVVHRDYSYQNSCIYLHMYSDRLEIDNPGGIFGGVSAEEIEGRSLRRNPVLADLLYRAGYGEKLGSGMIRIKEALLQNGNPPFEISASNFFTLRLLPRVPSAAGKDLSDRQLKILSAITEASTSLSSTEIARHLNVSQTTIGRDLKSLLQKNLLTKVGIGKAVRYRSVSP